MVEKEKYCLEHENEASRLEFQAALEHYSIKKELQGIEPRLKGKALDAGCGSGLVSRYLAEEFDFESIDACDLSDTRLRQAEELADSPLHKKIRFFKSSLDRIDAPDSHYDFVICRYVLEHLTHPLDAVKEFYRVQKAGGRTCLIDVDGMVFNIFTSNEAFNALNEELKRAWKTDLYIGRKLPSLLEKSGFTEINTEIYLMDFSGANLENERELTRQRLEQIRPTLVEAFHSQEKAAMYEELYLKLFSVPGTTLFYNKFVVTALKKS